MVRHSNIWKMVLSRFCSICEKKNFEKVALVMENCGPHGADLLDRTEKLSGITLPCNCTSMFQPMDMGIIVFPKVRYRSLLLQRMLEVFENRSKLRKAAKKLAAGLKGWDKGHDPHMLDVAEMLEDVWESVTERTTARCWIKSYILAKCVNGDLINKHGKVSDKKKSGLEIEMDKVMNVFEKL